MVLTTLYFQLHQPFRLHPDRDKFLWDEKNKQVFSKVADKCYIPATKMFAKLLKENPEFKIAMSMSGTFLEQAETDRKDVIHALQDLYDAGKEKSQIEFLDETYYHSLASLFEDPVKLEFRKQVSLHRQKLEEIFGKTAAPTSFRNTELMFNNAIAEVVADMGYKSILCEKRDDMFLTGKNISPNAVFRAKGAKSQKLELLVIPRNRELSDDIAFRFPHTPQTAENYARNISQISGEAVLLGYDYEHIGEHIWEDTGIFEFWKHLPKELAKYKNIVMANPTEIAQRFKNVECPSVDINPLATSSWADKEKDTSGWLGSETQHILFKDIEKMEEDANKVKGEFREKWRHLTTSDQIYFLHEAGGQDGTVHAYFSPYDSLSRATRVITRKVDDLASTIKNFQILKRTERTPVIMISPETAKLPSEEMGELAEYVSGKSGGLGDVVAALCKGLVEKSIPVHFITLNLRKRFIEEAGMSEEDWIQKRHELNPKNIHLVTSPIFENHHTPYDCDTSETAAEFQKQIINYYVKDIRNKYSGRAIIHTHDWMSGGAITAYAKVRGIPTIHTVHNTHTGNIPLDMLQNIGLQRFEQDLYVSVDHGRRCLDSQATAIKSAAKVSFVGKTFLNEIINDYFLDRHIIPSSVRQETKAKFYAGSALAIPNGVSPESYPENKKVNPALDMPGLAMSYNPETKDVIEAKRANLLKFQNKTGLQTNPNAILLYWPSRLDPNQKGIEILEDIALKFVIEHPDTQIAVIGNGVGGDRTHEDIMRRIAFNSGGKICYHPFNEDLSTLGYAASSDVFGASLYEPFGLIDVVGNLFGSTSTNRNTGGYHDKIIDLELKKLGAPEDVGNGVLFKNYDSTGLWYGLDQTVQNHRYFRRNPAEHNKQAKRIMSEARDKHDYKTMIAEYIRTYESLNNGKPLA